jgi:hypothetical protein
MLKGMLDPNRERHLSLVPPAATLEGLVQTDPKRAAELQAVFDVTPIEQITAQTGLGFDELSQVITYTVNGNTKTGTLAEVVTDTRCPVGGMISKRFSKSGIEGVERLVTGWSEDDPDMKVTFSESTLKGEPSLGVAKPEVIETAPEAPDFSAEVPHLKKKWLLAQ